MPSKQPLSIVADGIIWGVESAFSSLPGFDVSLSILDSREINREAVKHADILLTRSYTKVNAELLDGTAVRFAGTATIGDDHYDKSYLQSHNIAFANAAGSSTGSVVEYMMAALFELHAQGLIDIPRTTLGIIGAGRIGSALQKRCAAIGMKVLLNDPPRARREGSADFLELSELLDQADLISIHTPLIREGTDKTTHLINGESLRKFHGTGVINAARGVCLDNQALTEWLDESSNQFAVLDCWEQEPAVSTKLLGHPQMAIATPHIAGHSLDGKAANTLYIYRALCDWLEVEPVWNVGNHLPAVKPAAEVHCGPNAFANIQQALKSLYPIMNEHQAMRTWAALPEQASGEAFATFRRNYPVRRAWKYAPVHLIDADAQTMHLAHAIGLKTV